MTRKRSTGGLPWLVVSATAASLACSEAPVAPESATQDHDEVIPIASGAKPPAPPPATLAATTINNQTADGTETGIRNDGKGAYVSGVCGVYADMHVRDDGQRGTILAPANTPLTSAEQAACGGPRQATLRLTVRHLSDNPHVDDTSSPLGDYVISNWGIVLYTGGAAKINAPPACFLVGRNGRVSGHGLRFQPADYPGSSSLLITQTGPNNYRIQTQPWPNNIGWCENNDGISLWHVVMDAQVDPKS